MLFYAYDAAGNRLTRNIPKVDTDEEVVAEYRYDGLGRRIYRGTNQLGEIRRYYYNEGWQLLEERHVASTVEDPDPIGYEGGSDSLYESVNSRPNALIDPRGEEGIGVGGYGTYCGPTRKAACDGPDKPSRQNNPSDDVD